MNSFYCKEERREFVSPSERHWSMPAAVFGMFVGAAETRRARYADGM